MQHVRNTHIAPFTLAFVIGAMLIATETPLTAAPEDAAIKRESITFSGYADRATATYIWLVLVGHQPPTDSVFITCIKYTNDVQSMPSQVTLVLEDAGDSNRIIGKYVFQLSDKNRLFKLPQAAENVKHLHISIQP